MSYKMGIIDFLTRHSFAKTIETKTKSMLYGVDESIISAQAPEPYQ